MKRTAKPSKRVFLISTLLLVGVSILSGDFLTTKASSNLAPVGPNQFPTCILVANTVGNKGSIGNTNLVVENTATATGLIPPNVSTTLQNSYSLFCPSPTSTSTAIAGLTNFNGISHTSKANLNPAAPTCRLVPGIAGSVGSTGNTNLAVSAPIIKFMSPALKKRLENDTSLFCPHLAIAPSPTLPLIPTFEPTPTVAPTPTPTVDAEATTQAKDEAATAKAENKAATAKAKQDEKKKEATRKAKEAVISVDRFGSLLQAFCAGFRADLVSLLTKGAIQGDGNNTKITTELANQGYDGGSVRDFLVDKKSFTETDAFNFIKGDIDVARKVIEQKTGPGGDAESCTGKSFTEKDEDDFVKFEKSKQFKSLSNRDKDKLYSAAVSIKPDNG